MQRGPGGGRGEFGGYGGSGGAERGPRGGTGLGGAGMSGAGMSGAGMSGAGMGGARRGDAGMGGAGMGGAGTSGGRSGSFPGGGGRYGSEGYPGRAWFDEGWSDREGYGSGGGTGYTGPSGLGWQTDRGYAAGATGYGGSGSGALGDPGSRTGQGGLLSRNRGPKGWQRSDERIHDDVCERLSSEPGIDPSEVEVEVSGGTVTLTGSVPDRGMKYRIEDIVDGCSGVRDVDNRLRVSRGLMGGLLGTSSMGQGTTTDARSAASGGSATGPGGTRIGGSTGTADSGSRGSLLGRLFGFTTGTRLSDIMTRTPRTVLPGDTLQAVAQAMREQDVGAIPVAEGRRLVGMITDRDIVLRAGAEGRALADTRVSEVMTTQVHTCYEDEDVESALDKMGNLQVRRIPVVDRADQLVGIVSLGDFAQREAGDVEDALQDISKPT